MHSLTGYLPQYIKVPKDVNDEQWLEIEELLSYRNYKRSIVTIMCADDIVPDCPSSKEPDKQYLYTKNRIELKEKLKSDNSKNMLNVSSSSSKNMNILKNIVPKQEILTSYAYSLTDNMNCISEFILLNKNISLDEFSEEELLKMHRLFRINSKAYKLPALQTKSPMDNKSINELKKKRLNDLIPPFYDIVKFGNI